MAPEMILVCNPGTLDIIAAKLEETIFRTDEQILTPVSNPHFLCSVWILIGVLTSSLTA
jgi:hypothetical protein